MNSSKLNGTFTRDTGPLTPADAVFIIIAILIIIFNGIVLFIMRKYRSLRSAPNVLLASLAVSDLSSGLVGIPLSFACSYVPRYLCGLCGVSYYFFKFISISTVLHILTIIAERCFLIVNPILHRRLRATPGKSNWVIIATIWSTSLVVSCIPWIWVATIFSDCFSGHEWNDATWNPDAIYEFSCLILFFLVPLVLISIFLTKIFIAVHQFTKRKSQRCFDDVKVQIQLRKTEMRIFIVLVFVFVLFIVCWLPYFAITLFPFINNNELPPKWLDDTAAYTRSITSVLNPFVYAFYKDDVYQAIKKKFKSLKCWSRKMDGEIFSSKRRTTQLPLVNIGKSV